MKTIKFKIGLLVIIGIIFLYLSFNSSQYTPPIFHDRNGAESLSEMMQEPPTTVYGSTIDVFQYNDSSGKTREITIAGHADSNTCGKTTGAFAGALLYTPTASDNFLLAGSGRMIIPESNHEEHDRLSKKESVLKYEKFTRKLNMARFFVKLGLQSKEEAEKGLEVDFETAQANLDLMTKNPDVKAFLELDRPATASQAFLKEAKEIAELSGMLRLHKLPYSLIEETNNRITKAISNSNTTIRFDDLLEAKDAEAVIYTPMRKLDTNEEFTIRIPLGELSLLHFQKAAKIHRSALENSVVGHAKKRLEHATKLHKGALDDRNECQSYGATKLSNLIPGLRTCNKDGCVGDRSSGNITYSEYCEKNVPNNIDIAKSWIKEAEELLSTLKSLKEKSSENQIDILTHAALIDSMLRDWALPFPDAQEAFDYWRDTVRKKVWKSIAQELDRADINHKVLSGGNVIFNVEINHDMLVIHPIMVVDLKRSIIVINKEFGVTAIANTWDFRKKEITKSKNPIDGKVLSLLISDQKGFTKKLKETPEYIISKVQTELLEQMPIDQAGWKERTKTAMDYNAVRLENELEVKLKELENSFTEKDNSDWLKLLPLANIAASTLRISPEFRLRTAIVIAHKLQRTDGVYPIDPWGYLLSSMRGEYIPSHKISFDLLFGNEPSELFLKIIQAARDIDKGYVNSALQKKELPQEHSVTYINNRKLFATPLPTLTYVVNTTNEVLDKLLLRSLLKKAINLFDKTDGSVSFSQLNDLITSNYSPKTIVGIFEINRFNLSLRFAKRSAGTDHIGAIEGLDLFVELSRLIHELNNELRTSEKLISTIRFGHSQEALVARMMFERGAYSKSLDKIFPDSVPLHLYYPSMTWTILNKSARGIPTQIVCKENKNSIIVSAQLTDGDVDVLRLDGLSQDARTELINNPPNSVYPWNEGDLLWEQVLTAKVSAPQIMQDSLKALSSNKNLRQGLLKAMVYACAIPAKGLIDPIGRCLSANGSIALHDRVKDNDVIHFVTPNLDDMSKLANEYFTSKK